jgi:hypothetical protein
MSWAEFGRFSPNSSGHPAFRGKPTKGSTGKSASADFVLRLLPSAKIFAPKKVDSFF